MTFSLLRIPQNCHRIYHIDNMGHVNEGGSLEGLLSESENAIWSHY
ncbi:MAG: hypothetical protein RJB38_1922, partial [Pseudomonadota bacterium]